MNFLDDKERVILRIQHKQEREGRIRDRIKAGLFNKSLKLYCFLMKPFRNHIDEYKTSKKLWLESGGSQEKFSDKQSRELETHLKEHTYLYVKDIVVYVQITFNITYTIHGMRS